MIVRPLDRDETRRRASALAAIDAGSIAEMGDEYSHERWSVDHFLKDFPGKWDHSQIALDGERAIGFWVAWTRGADVHTSRVAVMRAARSRGAGRLMFDAVVRAARASGHAAVTLTTASGNTAARRFYQRLGFRPLSGADLDRFMHDTGRPGTPDGTEIREIANGIERRYVAWRFDLEA